MRILKKREQKLQRKLTQETTEDSEGVAPIMKSPAPASSDEKSTAESLVMI